MCYNSKRPIFFGGSAGLITGSVKSVSLNSILGVSTCLSKELWCPFSKSTSVLFYAAILRETREYIFVLTLTLLLKKGYILQLKSRARVFLKGKDIQTHTTSNLVREKRARGGYGNNL